MVWNATTSQCVVGPYQGHTDIVTSIGHSPDGTQIVSGSDDKTIRIWNVATDQYGTDLLQGHTDWVYSVVYSHNGSHIVSGSYDGTIRF